jgi:hypothetical protein
LTNGTLVSGVFSQRSSAVNEIEMYGRSHRLRFSLYEGNSLQMTPASSTPVDWKARVQRMGVAIASAPGSLARARRGGDFLESYRNQWIALRASVCDGAAPLSSWEDGRRCLRALCEAVTPVHAHE